MVIYVCSQLSNVYIAIFVFLGVFLLLVCIKWHICYALRVSDMYRFNLSSSLGVLVSDTNCKEGSIRIHNCFESVAIKQYELVTVRN